MKGKLLIAAAVLIGTSSGPLLAKGSGGSHGHSDLTITKKADPASPKMMSNKPAGTSKVKANRNDPYKNFNFR
jgi:type VI protein secretion system component Hcp